MRACVCAHFFFLVQGGSLRHLGSRADKSILGIHFRFSDILTVNILTFAFSSATNCCHGTSAPNEDRTNKWYAVQIHTHPRVVQ